MAQNRDYSVIGITETWGNETINDAELHVEDVDVDRVYERRLKASIPAS